MKAASTALLAAQFAAAADARATALAVVSVWTAIDAALAPIIGPLGVAALYRRSLHLTAAKHPWLGGKHEGIQPTMDLLTLASLLESQERSIAAAGGAAVLETFEGLLCGLIGASLTDRLLGSVWNGALAEMQAQRALP